MTYNMYSMRPTSSSVNEMDIFNSVFWHWPSHGHGNYIAPIQYSMMFHQVPTIHAPSYQERRVLGPIDWFNALIFFVPVPTKNFQHYICWVFVLFRELKWEVFVHFADMGWIVDHLLIFCVCNTSSTEVVGYASVHSHDNTFHYPFKNSIFYIQN